MIIYFVTSQPEICQIFQKNLTEHKCFIYSDLQNVYELIFVSKYKPDLLVVDYSLFNHDFFNIFQELDNLKIRIPLIYYNDPTIIAIDRITQWKLTIEFFDIDNSELDFSKFESVFQTIANLVDSPELSQYIKLMQKPKPLPRKMLINYLYNDYTLEDLNKNFYKYRNLKGMTDGLFLILEILYLNQQKPMSLEYLQLQLAKNNKYVKIDSLNVELSRLRTILRKYPENRIEIINRNKQYQLIEY